MNSVVLTGRLVKDPDVAATVTKFTIAVDRISKDKGADFIRIVTFGKTAENCGKYLAKGKQVAVEGRIQTGSYEKDGQKVFTQDVIGERVEFLGSSGGNGNAAAPIVIPEGFQVMDDDDDDSVPF